MIDPTRHHGLDIIRAVADEWGIDGDNTTPTSGHYSTAPSSRSQACIGATPSPTRSLETSADPAGLTARAGQRPGPIRRAARPRESVRGRKPETRTIEGTARRGTGTASSGRLSRTEGQVMPIRWRTLEYERTCDDCGHVWRVPRWAAPPLHVQGRPVSGGCEGGVPPPAAAVMADPAVAATAQLAERAAVFFRRCHECGSKRYKQRSIWSWTDDPAC